MSGFVIKGMVRQWGTVADDVMIYGRQWRGAEPEATGPCRLPFRNHFLL